MCLAKKSNWTKYSNGITSEDVVVKFCPSLSENHKCHGMVEAKVGAIKRVVGRLDMIGMDAVKLNNFLTTFFHSINDLPLITKISPSEKNFHGHILSKTITPNMLVGKRELSIFCNQEVESILQRTEKHIKLLDILCWDFLTLLTRHQPKEDVPAVKLRIGGETVPQEH